VSRALGDRQFKAEHERLVIATPDIASHTVGDDDAFIVIACDGLFDVMDSGRWRT
jgi:protein phosphatase 2C family protein 2/3